MKLSVHELQNQIETYLSMSNTLRYRHCAGLSSDLDLAQLDSRFAELFRADTFRDLRPLATQTSTATRVGRQATLEFLANLVEEGAAREASAALATLESAAAVSLEGESTSVRDGAARLPRESQRGRRQELERALADFLWEHEGHYAQRVEAAIQTAKALGFPNYLAMREAVDGLGYQSLAAECDGLLAQTEDAYRDLLGYALKRLEPDLAPWPRGGAQAHDLDRACTAPWLMEHFRREELLASVTRCLSEVGLPPHAEGRILLDSEERPGKKADVYAAPLKVPDDVRLVLRPAAGLPEFSSLLYQFGLAQQWANASRSGTVEERWLREPALMDGLATVFDHLLLDPAWHKRYLRLPQSASRDAARLAAFRQLAGLRGDCAQLTFELSLYERGAVRPLAEEYQERKTAAGLVAVQRGLYLFSVRPHLWVARRLRGRALESVLHRTLLERFNEDYWRNPGAGRWLKERFAHPYADAGEMAAELGAELRLAEAGARLVEVLNL